MSDCFGKLFKSKTSIRLNHSQKRAKAAAPNTSNRVTIRMLFKTGSDEGTVESHHEDVGGAEWYVFSLTVC